MSRVYLDYDGKKWNEVEKSDFWIDKALLQKLDNLKKIQAKQWDGVFIVDGPERSGKSVLGMLCGWYLSDCKLTINNFALGLHDAASKIATLPEGSVLIMDEGSTIFSSRKSSDRMQKNLIEILDVVGQKNLFFIIILPCFFDLNKTIAARRSKFLLHVYPDDEYNRGRYAFWGEKVKSKLYIFGKKNFDSYGFPRAEFLGQYFEFHAPFYEEYLTKVKGETLKKVLANAITSKSTSRDMHAREVELAVKLQDKIEGISAKKIAEVFGVSEKTAYNWTEIYRIHKKEKEAKNYVVMEALVGEVPPLKA